MDSREVFSLEYSGSIIRLDASFILFQLAWDFLSCILYFYSDRFAQGNYGCEVWRWFSESLLRCLISIGWVLHKEYTYTYVRLKIDFAFLQQEGFLRFSMLNTSDSHCSKILKPEDYCYFAYLYPKAYPRDDIDDNNRSRLIYLVS